MRRTIKNRTYNNFLLVMNSIQKKGYDQEIAADITRKIFDQYEENPEGLPIWSRVDLIKEAQA